ncbi:hypothetical protein FOL46_008075 [Perkinsus olseni]|uniref:Uncharacterized protein n=1 Tax=Perkinsus olseni TaxID=32597 RepID=A0A7J6L9J4_PEROL|nr:hypothetical protein FOL46_008075 [Perkinsus olseni]
MTMTNKSLASSTTTTLSPELILFVECIVTCLGLQMIYSLGLANRPCATLRMRVVWQSLVPVTLLKAGNMQLSFIAMKFTSLPIYNVLKRLTPLCALLTDWALRGQKPRTRGVVVAVGLLTFGSICAGIDLGLSGLGDLDFDPWGYAAALTATLCQSGYLVMAARARDSLEKAELMDTTTLLYYTAFYNATLFFGPVCLYELLSSSSGGATMADGFRPEGVVKLLFYCVLGALLNFVTFECK